MTTATDPYRAAVQALDAMEREVSDWEAAFLDSCLRWRGAYTPTQQRRIVQLCDKYALKWHAAECLVQQRLFA